MRVPPTAFFTCSINISPYLVRLIPVADDWRGAGKPLRVLGKAPCAHGIRLEEYGTVRNKRRLGFELALSCCHFPRTGSPQSTKPLRKDSSSILLLKGKAGRHDQELIDLTGRFAPSVFLRKQPELSQDISSGM